jgi:atypical dual specificity phosphatase
LLWGLDLTIRDRAVTAILGPGGTGKSTLLRALAGRPLETGWTLRGTWRYRGQPLLSHHPGDAELLWMPQVRHAQQTTNPGEWSLRGEPPRTLLLDEPARIDDDTRLRRHALHGAAVIVTHDLALARRVADDVCLLCAGQIVVKQEAELFFDETKQESELVRRFLSYGNCWPRPRRDLPTHFRWVIPGKLAGMGRPGLLGEVEDDIAAIAEAGITYLVTLTEEPPPVALLREHGVQARHFPIADMGVPPLGSMSSLCRDITRLIGDGEKVAVHCQAGLGRTGTVLASVLVWQGADPESAIRELKRIARGYVQTDSQHDFVRRLGESLRG